MVFLILLSVTVKVNILLLSYDRFGAKKTTTGILGEVVVHRKIKNIRQENDSNSFFGSERT